MTESGSANQPAQPAATTSQQGTSDPSVEKTRAVTGLIAVVAGDVAIAIAAILGIIYAARESGASSTTTQIVAILSGGFTAIGTMTTAYFGIKSMANTANNLAGPPTGAQRSQASNVSGP
jgi:TRAP-type C4-dicarboxylate transport system permease small subunit